ncbi:MAG: tetratricopeptide repeat protein, partial [Proteobacteria bacterium]|nr:tetratricopeptide repeat protein [Pseudomonadota bacterium]
MTLQTLLQEAQSLHQAGRLAEAEGLYRQVLAQVPPNFQLQHLLALVQFQQQRHGDALASVAAALAINPEASESLALKGALLAASGRGEDALILFGRALALKPDLPDALYNRALLLTQMNRPAEAVTDFDRLLALAPAQVEAWVNRGVALQQWGKLTDAIASYDRAIALVPGHMHAWLNRGTALQALGRFADALASFDKVVALAPRQAGAWIGRGRAQMGLQRFEEALESYDTALEIVPGDAPALEQRAALLETIKLLGDIPPGADALDVWQERGAVFQITQRFAEAVMALDKVLALDPLNSTALMRKGAVLCEARRVTEGM